VALLTLPMRSFKQNALMVNAIQRCSTIVAQNSLREGFGLTATEAMWKGVPVLGSCAVGLRHQVRDGLDGRLVRDPENPDEIAHALRAMLEDEDARTRMGRSAQRRANEEYLILSQLRRWMALVSE
jgi:trehalose synthase